MSKLFTVYLTGEDIARLQAMIGEEIEALEEDGDRVLSCVAREAIECAELDLQGINEELETAKHEQREGGHGRDH